MSHFDENIKLIEVIAKTNITDYDKDVSVLSLIENGVFKGGKDI